MQTGGSKFDHSIHVKKTGGGGAYTHKPSTVEAETGRSLGTHLPTRLAWPVSSGLEKKRWWTLRNATRGWALASTGSAPQPLARRFLLFLMRENCCFSGPNPSPLLPSHLNFYSLPFTRGLHPFPGSTFYLVSTQPFPNDLLWLLTSLSFFPLYT